MWWSFGILGEIFWIGNEQWRVKGEAVWIDMKIKYYSGTQGEMIVNNNDIKINLLILYETKIL